MNLITFPNLLSRPLGVRGAGGLPAPLEFSDDFARADGAIGNDWAGATWAIASAKAVNTPTLGAEGLADGGMENWINPNNLTSWTEAADGAAGNSVNQEATEIHGGTYSAKLLYGNGGSHCYIQQALAGQKVFYHVDYWEKAPATKGVKVVVDTTNSDDPNMYFTGTGSWVNRKRTIRTLAANTALRANKHTTFANGTSIYYDDMSAKPLTTAHLFATRPVYPTADYVLEVTIAAMEIGTMAGIVFGLDNPANPQNYVLIYHNGQTLWVKKVVSGGDFATVGSKVQTFSANDKITIAKQGTSVRVFLNDVAIAATFTISDATIKDNLYAGILGSYSGNQFDNWSETVKAVGGSDSFLAPFFSGATDGAIFAIGDSITAGGTDEVTGLGYPPLLTDLMAIQTHGYWREITPRGGHGGYDMLDIADVIDADLAATSGTATHVLILLGANDVVDTADHWQSFNETTWKAAAQAVIDAVHTKWSGARIYLGKSYRAGTYTTEFDAIAGWIDDLVADNPGVCYAGIDSRTFFTGHQAAAYGGSEPYLLVDDVHPNHAGFVVMAPAWQDEII